MCRGPLCRTRRYTKQAIAVRVSWASEEWRTESPPLQGTEDGATMSWARVYKLVKSVPRGRVVTYGQLARALRLRGGARTAGRAMAGCPSGRGIPWHRVVGAGGRLLIREPLASLQRRLLESEGVQVTENRVPLARYGWPRLLPKKKGRRAL